MLLCQLLKLSEKDIVEMVFFPVINEACRVLDEGIAVKASDLDTASIFGMGFPPYRSAFENPGPICLFQLNDGLFVIQLLTLYSLLQAGEVSCTGQIPSVQSTSMESWRSGQSGMAASSSLALTSLKEQQKGFLW